MSIEARTYDQPQLMQAARGFHETRAGGVNTELGGRRSADLQQLQEDITNLAQVMQSTHQEWLDNKLSPLRSYLGIDTDNSTSQLSALEEAFFAGLATTITLFDRTTDAFDPQDLVAGYTTEFVTTLRVCQQHDVGPNIAVRIARLSYRVGSNRLHALFMNYPELTTGLIERAALDYPTRPERFLDDYITTVDRLTANERYNDLNDSVIALAASGYPGNPEGFLDTFMSTVERLQNDDRYRDLNPNVVTVAASGYPGNPEGFLDTFMSTVERLQNDDRYRDLNPSIITVAALKYPGIDKGTGVPRADTFLDLFIETIDRLRERYSALHDKLITVAALYYPGRNRKTGILKADQYLNDYIDTVRRLRNDSRFRDLTDSVISVAAANYHGRDRKTGASNADTFLCRILRLKEDSRYSNLNYKTIVLAASRKNPELFLDQAIRGEIDTDVILDTEDFIF